VKSKNRREHSARRRQGKRRNQPNHSNYSNRVPFPLVGIFFFLPFFPGLNSLSFLSFVLPASFTMASPAPAEPKVKPSKPDEEAYKASLAQAEKEHTAAQEKLVRIAYFSLR
jgi:hypothetical protein